jgi:hypothetical protein
MIFAREINDGLTGLVKKIDAATAKNRDCRMGSFVVFLNDDEGFDKKVKQFADNNKIKRTVLTVTGRAGPGAYDVARDAEVTVVLYVDKTVKTNYAFKKGQMKPTDVDKILGDVSKILPDNK